MICIQLTIIKLLMINNCYLCQQIFNAHQNYLIAEKIEQFDLQIEFTINMNGESWTKNFFVYFFFLELFKCSKVFYFQLEVKSVLSLRYIGQLWSVLELCAYGSMSSLSISFTFDFFYSWENIVNMEMPFTLVNPQRNWPFDGPLVCIGHLIKLSHSLIISCRNIYFIFIIRWHNRMSWLLCDIWSISSSLKNKRF